MNKGTKIVLFTGLGILIAGVIVSVIAFALSGFRFRNAFAAEGAKRELKTIELTFPEAFSNIDISVPAADVTIYPTDDKAARIEYTSQDEEKDLEAYVKEDTLVFKRVEDPKDMQWLHPAQIMDNLASLMASGFIHEIKLDLYLPKRDYQKLELSSASGDIFSDKDLSAKEVSFSSVSGDISISALKNAETISLKTTSGSIHAYGLDIRSDLEALSVSGDVSLKQISAGGKLMSATTSGDLILRGISFDDASLDTISGDIVLEDVSAKTLFAKSVSGDVTGNAEESLNVHASSVSGNIRVPQGSKDNWKIETTSGDIRLLP